MAEVTDWTALDVNGRVLTRAEFIGTSNLPRLGVREMLVLLDGGQVRAVLRPDRGESIRVFTRRSLTLAPGAAQAQSTDPGGVVVIEIAPDPDHPERFVRLYVGREIVLSTEDLRDG